MLARVFFIVFILSYFLRFTSRVPALGAIRFELCLGLILFICTFLQESNDKWRFSIDTSKRLYYFIIYVFLSLPVVTWPGSVLRFHLTNWIKAAIFFVFMVALIRSISQLKLVFYIFMGTQLFRAFEPLYLHLTTGYWGSSANSMVGGSLTTLLRLSGSPHDVVNPNQLAWVIVNMVPFIFYLLWKGNIIGKMLSLTVTPPLVYALMLTGSRSGFLSLAFVLLAMVFFTKKRVRNLLIALVIVVPATMFVFSVISGDMQTRYLSIFDSGVAGGDTAQGRIDGIIRGLNSVSNNPLFGNGLGTSGETNVNILGGRRQITHNLYIEVIQEVGLIGFVLFILYIVSLFKCLAKAKNILLGYGEYDCWLYRLAVAMQAWIAMQMFYSLSCFGLSSWEWYFFGGVSTLCLVFSRKVGTTKNHLASKGTVTQNAV